MRTKLFFIVTTIMILLSACDPNRNVLYVTFENAQNIDEGSPVLMSGYKIGTVEQIEFDDKYNVRFKIRFNIAQKIPNDSRFTIGSEDMFKKAVVIDPGASKTYFTAKDEIKGTKSPTVDLDNLLDWFSDRFEESGAKSAADSIASGLNELSEKLEEFENMEIEIKKQK